MWYLVLPPIIVVLSLIFLLWYLSRKGADPSIAEKMSHLEADSAVSFSRTKEFFLRILEKIAQRSKVRSLRMHNTLNDWTQTIKERRRQAQESVFKRRKEDQKIEEISEREAPVVSEDTSVYQESSVAISTADDILGTLIFRQRKASVSEKLVSPAGEIFPKRTRQIQRERPMISETAAHPEEKKISQDASREEMLIARIALNPKDFTAYETLGDYYLERENIKDAKECYRQVLKLSPVQRMVKIKIRRLEKFLSEQK